MKKYKGFFTDKPRLTAEAHMQEMMALILGVIFGAILSGITALIIRAFFPPLNTNGIILVIIIFAGFPLWWLQQIEYEPEDFEEYWSSGMKKIFKEHLAEIYDLHRKRGDLLIKLVNDAKNKVKENK